MIEADKYYTGKFVDFAIVAVGGKGTKAAQFTIDIPGEGKQATLVFLGNSKGSDGLTNNERLRDRLIEFGCDRQRLASAGWSDHIKLTLDGKDIQAKAEEYNGKINLKNIYVPGEGSGLKPLTLEGSPFGESSSDELVPF
jgi:hypothetical protein